MAGAPIKRNLHLPVIKRRYANILTTDRINIKATELRALHRLKTLLNQEKDNAARIKTSAERLVTMVQNSRITRFTDAEARELNGMVPRITQLNVHTARIHREVNYIIHVDDVFRTNSGFIGAAPLNQFRTPVPAIVIPAQGNQITPLVLKTNFSDTLGTLVGNLAGLSGDFDRFRKALLQAIKETRRSLQRRRTLVKGLTLRKMDELRTNFLVNRIHLLNDFNNCIDVAATWRIIYP